MSTVECDILQPFLQKNVEIQRSYRTNPTWPALVLVLFFLSLWLYKSSKQEINDNTMPVPVLPPASSPSSPNLPAESHKRKRARRRKLQETPTKNDTARWLKPATGTSQTTTSPKKGWKNASSSRTVSFPKTNQPFDAFLVLDVEATCHPGTGFDWPNEIIEWPVCLMRWKSMKNGTPSQQLELVDTFHSFVKPTWRPQLSPFCTQLTGITQHQVDTAPSFPDVLKSFSAFLSKHGLVDAVTGERLVRFCWCSDGPYDIRDFVAKQCFISKIAIPHWIRGDVLDVRMMVMIWLHNRQALVPQQNKAQKPRPPLLWRAKSLNISGQLDALGLAGFEGREHSGIDDARNISRILSDLARKGLQLGANTPIPLNKRWIWMGRRGEILEEYCPCQTP